MYPLIKSLENRFRDSAEPADASSNIVRIILTIFATWLAVVAIFTYRLEHLGAFTSIGSRRILHYVKDNAQANPVDTKLNQSYSAWALDLNGTDAANYIKAGLGFADGKGVSLKEISPQNPNNKTYFPYYYQAAGAPILIGIIIKLFGEQQVLPYYVFVLLLHLTSALCTCLLASHFFKEERYILGVGLLSLLCLPALYFNFGLGIFCGEPPAALSLVLAFICLSTFWTKLEAFISYKQLALLAIGFGGALAIAAYCRDIYTAFAQFCFLALLLSALFKKNNFKRITLFVVIASLTLSALEYPWQKRNQKYFGEFTMTGETYCGYALWYFIWDDYKKSSRWAGNSGHGLGNYLAPEKSSEVLRKLEENKKTGGLNAMKCLAQAIANKPLEAIAFKLNSYGTLWFGRSKHWYVFGWCLLSTLSFFIFLFLTRFRFTPQLWLFPLFLFCLSPLIHYEHRYSQPFFFLITPITSMYVLRHMLLKLRQSKMSTPMQAASPQGEVSANI